MNISRNDSQYSEYGAGVDDGLSLYASGPWIPQTPDSQRHPDPEEQWQQGNDDDDDGE